MSKLMSSAVQSNTKAAPQCDHSNVSESPRRQFLRFAAAGAAVGLAAKLASKLAPLIVCSLRVRSRRTPP